MTYSLAFEKAVQHCMLYEVGGWWKLTPDVEEGLIDTRSQRRATGYVDDPDDAGGETKFGVAKNANPDLDIQNLTWSQAKDVYYNRYWLDGHCDELPPRVAVLHFDCCINHGIKRAVRLLQQAVGVDDDGVMGPKTLDAVDAMDPIDVCSAMSDARVKFYKEIVANKPTQSKFLAGWLSRASDLRIFTCNPDTDFA